MNSKFFIVTIGAWFIFMILAIINAGIRNNVYKPIVGDLAAHQISTIIFVVLISYSGLFGAAICKSGVE